LLRNLDPYRWIRIVQVKEHTMSKQHTEKHPHADKGEAQIDQAVEDSFPASDAPSTGGKTRLEPKEVQHRLARRGIHQSCRITPGFFEFSVVVKHNRFAMIFYGAALSFDAFSAQSDKSINK
jgi:hypothetical protein